MICITLTIIGEVIINEVIVTDLYGNSYSVSRPAPLNETVKIYLRMDRAPTAIKTVTVYDNDKLIETLITRIGYYLTPFDYIFTVSGTHNICAEVI